MGSGRSSAVDGSNRRPTDHARWIGKVTRAPHAVNLETVAWLTADTGASISAMSSTPVPTPDIRGWLRGVAGIVYPPTCLLCGAAGDAGLDLCAGCRADLPVIGPCCARCSLPLPPTVVTSPDRPTLCGGCQRRPPPFHESHALFRYEDPLPVLIAGLKFRGRLHVLRLLGMLLGETLRERVAELPDAIVPVPLHRRRLRQRGYNQSLELARIVGRALQVPVDDRCCERVLATRPQAELEKKARLGNLRGAFRATQTLDGRHIALLDDVVTTAATVTELTRVLRRAGARRVDVWALARTP